MNISQVALPTIDPSFQARQRRLRDVSFLLTSEYPALTAAGITTFVAVHHALAEEATLEAYLDSACPDVLVRIMRKGRALDTGKVLQVTEVGVKKYLSQWMFDTLRTQVFEGPPESWRVHLRHKLRHITAARETGLSADIPQGLWSKQRLYWKVQIACKGRDIREPPYPHPFIRHIRLKHDGLGRLNPKWSRNRLAQWNRKKKMAAKRKEVGEGFKSPLRTEIELETESDGGESMEGLGDGSEAQALETGWTTEDEDRREVAALLVATEGLAADSDSSSSSSRAAGGQEGSRLETTAMRSFSAFGIAPDSSPTPLWSIPSSAWNWGQCWSSEATAACDIGNVSPHSGMFGRCA